MENALPEFYLLLRKTAKIICYCLLQIYYNSFSTSSSEEGWIPDNSLSYPHKTEETL